MLVWISRNQVTEKSITQIQGVEGMLKKILHSTFFLTLIFFAKKNGILGPLQKIKASNFCYISTQISQIHCFIEKKNRSILRNTNINQHEVDIIKYLLIKSMIKVWQCAKSQSFSSVTSSSISFLGKNITIKTITD